MGGSQLTTVTVANNNMVIDFIILLIGILVII